jgi:small subunit ribosomal protein S15
LAKAGRQPKTVCFFYLALTGKLRLSLAFLKLLCYLYCIFKKIMIDPNLVAAEAILALTVSRLGKKPMLDKKIKEKIIKKFQEHANDTGSPQVQIAILTEEIKQLTKHLQEHRKDFSSRRGLLKKVSERRKLLKYLQKENEKAFTDVAEKLKLKIAKKMEEDKEREDELAKLAEEGHEEDLLNEAEIAEKNE